jgi:hypothetical protein
VSKLRRLRSCGRGTRGDTVDVHRIAELEGPRATVTGLQSCGSVWSCPVCAAHIRYVRSVEVAEACVRHLDAGGGLLFLTLTLRHHRGERLEQLLDGLLNAHRRTFQGAPWDRVRDRFGIVGRIRSTEATWGSANGWHPHLHLLLFLEDVPTRSEVAELEAWLAHRWAAMVERQGLQLPDHDHGCRLELVSSGEGVGQYVAKVQEAASVPLELTRGDLKTSRTGLVPFELLEAAGDGERDALALWWEYEAATHRRRCIEWTRGLRDLLGIGEEVDDAAIVAEDTTTDDSLLVTLRAEDWHAVCGAGLDVELLEAAEDHGLHGVLLVVAEAVERRRS